MYAELNERAEAATGSYSVTGDSLQSIYSFVQESSEHPSHFPSQIFFNHINHGYRAAILKKNSLWLLPFYMVVATYFYYEKVHRTMRTAIVSNLLNTFMIYNELKASLRNHHDKVARRHAVDRQGNT